MPGSSPSHLRAAARLLAAGFRRGRSPDLPPGGVPRRRIAVELGGIVADPRRVRRYLSATRGGGISALQGTGAGLPPTYTSVWETALALELLSQEGAPLPRRGMIHLESEMVAIRPLRYADRVRSRLELDGANPHRLGTVVTVKARHWNGTGQLCQDNRLLLLLPAPARHGFPSSPTREEARTNDTAEWVELAEWDIGAGHGRRYARASGDYNPIHLWRWSSRLLGFDRPILHGFCTQAMVVHEVVERLLGGDPGALRRFGIRFRESLVLPARVRLLWSPDGGGDAGRFRLVEQGSPEGRRPYAEGEWVGG